MSDKKTLPKLFSYDSNNRVKEWEITIEGDSYSIIHGLSSGKLTTTPKTLCKGKNLGRSNETSPEEQALREATAKWTKQLDKNYHENLEDAVQLRLPMLAKKYQDAKNAIEWPCMGLYKLDGVRCTVFCKNGEITFQSRGGKEYPVIKEIADELLRDYFEPLGEEVVLDGELYAHELHLEHITSAVKKHNQYTEDINFYIFDMISSKEDLPYLERYARYKAVAAVSSCERVNGVSSVELNNEEEMLKLHRQAVSEGFEGVVLRNPDAQYRFNYRTKDFQKYKESLDREFKVVDIVLDKHGGGIPVCEVYLQAQDHPETFKATYAGTHEFRKKLGSSPEEFIGKWLTVEFESYSLYGIPLKPIGKCFREINDKGEVQV